MTTTPEKTNRSRLDPEPMPRRDFLGLAAMFSAFAAGFLSLLGMARLPRAAVLPSPSRKFAIDLPPSLAPGVPFIPPGRSVAVIRDKDGGVFAISTICTHLGCIVKESPDGFLCPCHGSRFAADGSLTRGPAPKALMWLQVQPLGDGRWVIDESKGVPLGTKAMA